MCFSTNRVNQSARKTKEDLIGYKVLRRRTASTGKITLHSPVKTFKWKPRKVNIANYFDSTSIRYNVYHGFHCFRTLKDAESSQLSGQIYSVKIPAGSKVHKNENQFCSDKMMLRTGIPLKSKR